MSNSTTPEVVIFTDEQIALLVERANCVVRRMGDGPAIVSEGPVIAEVFRLMVEQERNQ